MEHPAQRFSPNGNSSQLTGPCPTSGVNSLGGGMFHVAVGPFIKRRTTVGRPSLNGAPRKSAQSRVSEPAQPAGPGPQICV